MLTSLVNPGDNVEMTAISRVAPNPGAEKKIYTSKVYDVINDEKIEILMPIVQKKIILLPVDGEYKITFFTAKGLYACTARVADRYKDNNVYTLLFEVTSDLKKQQRREYFRYACVLPMQARELLPDEMKSIEQGELYIEPGLPKRESTIVDISGGGMRFVGKEVYEKDSLIVLEFLLPVNEIQKRFEIVAKVLISQKIPNKVGEYEHRVQFTYIKKDAREEIIRFIFEEERKNRRKEKR